MFAPRHRYIYGDYDFLDFTKPNFGANDLKWIHNDFTPNSSENLIFKLSDPRLPDGCAYGKVFQLHRNIDLFEHPKHRELEMLAIIHEKYPGHKNLPHPIACFPYVPNVSPGLFKLPMRLCSNLCHPVCAVSICPKYSYDLAEYVEACEVGVDKYKAILKSLLVTLKLLQDDLKLMHNDIHANNILFDKDGNPILWDFELVTAFTDEVGKEKLRYNLYKGPSYCVPSHYLPTHDIHSLLYEFYWLPNCPEEIRNFIATLYPKELLEDTSDQTESNGSWDTEEDETSDAMSIDSDDESDGSEEDDEFELNTEEEFKTLLSGLSFYVNGQQEGISLCLKEMMLTVPPLEDESRDIKEIVSALIQHESTPAILLGEIKRMRRDWQIKKKQSEWFYGPKDVYLSHWHSDITREVADENSLADTDHLENQFDFFKPNKDGLLARQKLCRKAWETYKLPTADDVLEQTYLS